MGMYDEYDGVQLKVGPCELARYDVGDRVPIEDGIYVGWEGIVVVRVGIFAFRLPHLLSKWGDIILPEGVLDSHDYVSEALSQMEED